jgi:hypothetical protein
MNDYYPPGVTGNEDAFGPSVEREAELHCHDCGKKTEHSN